MRVRWALKQRLGVSVVMAVTSAAHSTDWIDVDQVVYHPVLVRNHRKVGIVVPLQPYTVQHANAHASHASHLLIDQESELVGAGWDVNDSGKHRH